MKTLSKIPKSNRIFALQWRIKQHLSGNLKWIIYLSDGEKTKKVNFLELFVKLEEDVEKIKNEILKYKYIYYFESPKRGGKIHVFEIEKIIEDLGQVLKNCEILKQGQILEGFYPTFIHVKELSEVVVTNYMLEEMWKDVKRVFTDKVNENRPKDDLLSWDIRLESLWKNKEFKKIALVYYILSKDKVQEIYEKMEELGDKEFILYYLNFQPYLPEELKVVCQLCQPKKL